MDRVDQIIDGCHAAFFRDAGEMSVTGCCFGAGMAEKGLNVTKAQALLKQMSGIALPEGVYGNFFLMPHSATRTRMAFWTPPRSMWVVAF